MSSSVKSATFSIEHMAANACFRGSFIPRSHIVRSRVVTRIPPSSSISLPRQLPLAAAGDGPPDAAARQQEHVHRRDHTVGVGLQHHRRPVQPRRRSVCDDGVLRDHEAQALEPELEAVGQLCCVHDAVDRRDQETGT